MKNSDIERAKKEGHENRIDFEDNRDGMEEKYHVNIIYYLFFLSY